MIQAIKDQDAMGRGLLCISGNLHETLPRHMCDIEVGKISVLVMSTASPVDSLAMAMQ